MNRSYFRLAFLGIGASVLFLAVAAHPRGFSEDEGWISLFNGKDLTGWHLRRQDGPNRWTVENGVYTTASRGTDILTDAEFYDFQLHVEFTIVPGGNSGVYMRDRYEIQILDSFGKPMTESSCGALYRRIMPSANACRPAGEWEEFDITFVGQRLTVYHNGKKILGNVEAGPKGTGGSRDRDDAPGPLRLQGDHGQVSFRNVRIRPLSKEEGALLLLK